ncbi:MAG TPA: hypothetical protein VFZ66_29770 [Herpetosiphonaceae bacterium]
MNTTPETCGHSDAKFAFLGQIDERAPRGQRWSPDKLLCKQCFAFAVTNNLHLKDRRLYPAATIAYLRELHSLAITIEGQLAGTTPSYLDGADAIHAVAVQHIADNEIVLEQIASGEIPTETQLAEERREALAARLEFDLAA